jgi:hypothetical protein
MCVSHNILRFNITTEPAQLGQLGNILWKQILRNCHDVFDLWKSSKS